MDMLRSADDVVSNLLNGPTETVITYHPIVECTPRSIDELIAGTACFPGRSGVWRGQCRGGPLPDNFPHEPVMFLAHNFDCITGFQRSLERKGEVDSRFWCRLLTIVRYAELVPEQCFFSNVLMGLKPGDATGPMPTAPGYRDQCLTFLRLQIDIVRPRAIVALGADAAKLVHRLGRPYASVHHRSARCFSPLDTREERLRFRR